MTCYRITLQSDTTPERCLAYRSQLRTAQMLGKEYMRKAGAVNEDWTFEENCVKFFIGENLWRINFEEINIEY